MGVQCLFTLSIKFKLHFSNHKFLLLFRLLFHDRPSIFLNFQIPTACLQNFNCDFNFLIIKLTKFLSQTLQERTLQC